MASLINVSLPILGVGYVVKAGYTPSPEADQIALNLHAGNNIGLHVNPRVNEGTIVLNSFINGSWGAEERATGFPLLVGQEISILIIILPTEFEIRGIIEGTEEPAWIYKYQHRLAADSLDAIEFHGKNVSLKYLYVQQAFSTESAGSLTFKTGDIIALKADNGKYLSLINHGNLDAIAAGKKKHKKKHKNKHKNKHQKKQTHSIPPYSQFVVTVLDNGKIALKADNGKYLSRINRGNIESIKAVKDEIDTYSQFTVTVLADNKILLKADNGKYLSRINRGKINPIEAAKNTSDVFCQFIVI
jgi:Galactoside-binding lectin